MYIRKIIDSDGTEKIILVEGEQEERTFYNIEKGKNGKNYCVLSSVRADVLHVSSGNSKTGQHVVNFNLPIEYTCNHACECYKEGKCYAEQGCYMYGSNQAGYSENYNFIRNSTNEQIIEAWQLALDYYGFSKWRFFTCGDIPFMRFIDCMVTFARNNPDVTYWTYTKKYSLVNKWIDENGSLPDNLIIIFSHWLNNDGSYYPMNNRHNLPTSEFIPYGQEHLKETVTHVCPCSDPSIVANCETCEHACYTLKHGESMALLEHSTAATKARDKQIKAAKEALKAGNK